MAINPFTSSRKIPPSGKSAVAPSTTSTGDARPRHASVSGASSASSAPSSALSALSSLMGGRRASASHSTVATSTSQKSSSLRVLLVSIGSKLFWLSLKMFESIIHQVLFGQPQKRTTVSPYTAMQLKKSIGEGKVQEISIAGHGGQLQGHLHKLTAAAHSGKTVLFLSGSGGTAEDQSSDVARKYASHGADVLAVNYRGFGKSEGVPSENGLLADAQSMLDHLVKEKGIAPEDIIVHAYSLGGPVGAHLSSMSAFAGRPLGGLVLDRPMVSASKSAEAHGVPLAKLSGQVLKQTQGSFSVLENMQNVPKDTSVVLLTDREGLGRQGEGLRGRLAEEGFQVSGRALDCAHDDSLKAMEHAFDTIQAQFLASRAPEAPTGQGAAPAVPQGEPAAPDGPTSNDIDPGIQRDFAHLARAIN